MLSECLFLYLCFVVGSYGQATSNLVPFIDKCVWNDEACLVASAKKAMPYFAKGLPEFGVEPMDPLKINKVTLELDSFKVQFTKLNVTGPGKWNILKVKRDIKKNQLKVVAEGPIDVVGHYESSGKLVFTQIDGKGPFHVHCKQIKIKVLVEINKVVGPDSVRYWKISKAKHSYEARKKCTFNFTDLFDGDMEKTRAVLVFLDATWKDIMKYVAKPIVDKVIDEIVVHVQTFASKIPADQLEKQ